MWKSTVLLVFASLCPFVTAAMDVPALVEDSPKLLGEAYGYCLGQTLTLDGIARKFPKLSGKVKYAKYRFHDKFGKSVTNIKEIMETKSQGRWKQVHAQIMSQLQDHLRIESASMSYRDAVAFLDDVDRRTKGEIPSPILETLLILNPDYRENPAQEIADKFTKRYSCDGSGKAKGVQFHLDYPSSWSSEPGNRPNIVRVFASENGKGKETILVLIKTIPVDVIQEMKAIGFPEKITKNELKSFMPAASTYCGSNPVTIEGVPGCWFEFLVSSSRMGVEISTRTRIYLLIHDNKWIQIQCSIVSASRKNLLKEEMNRFDPLFKLVANSFVLDSKWR